jgi:hypothetical protein
MFCFSSKREGCFFPWDFLVGASSMVPIRCWSRGNGTFKWTTDWCFGVL